MRLVLIEWVDSHVAVGGWKLLDDFDRNAKAPFCRSVGWVVRDDDEIIVVVPHFIEEQGDVARQGCGDMTIPKCSVVRVIDLEAPGPVGQAQEVSG